MAFGALYLKWRYTINPNAVYRKAMMRLNTSPAVLEVKCIAGHNFQNPASQRRSKPKVQIVQVSHCVAAGRRLWGRRWQAATFALRS